MKKAILVALALSSVSVFAAEPFMGLGYSCTGNVNGKAQGFNVEVSADRKTLTFTGLNAPVKSATLDGSIDEKNGYSTFVSETSGCAAPTPSHPFHCDSIFQVELQVSHQILEGAVQGDIMSAGTSYRCEELMMALTTTPKSAVEGK